MEFSIKALSPERYPGPCIAVGIFEPRKLSVAAGALDAASAGRIHGLLRAGDLDGRLGTTRVLYDVHGIAAERVLLVGLGPQKEFGEKQFRSACRAAVAAVRETGAREACLALCEIPVPERDTRWKSCQLVLAAADAAYGFDRMKSKKAQARPLTRIAMVFASKKEAAAAESGAREGRAIAAGMALARDLGNLPANVCTPSYLAAAAVKLGKEWKFPVEVLDEKAMARLGMGSLLSVSKGSRQPPKLAILRYSGAGRKSRPVVLIGKGITFDTGGISIKPSAEMDEMKFDMCGAASVLGTMRAVAELGLKINLVGMIPTCENMPGGAASKPGDIVTSMSGQTIEILNTDAEGRLILADAMTYAERFDPQSVVDVATLTGACVIALGHVCAGLFSNRDALARELLAAGEASSDRAWQLPLWEDYQEQLRSNFADFANIGGRAAGSITAACFLSRFAGRYDWAHLDIAGIAWKSGKEKGATGRPVPLLTTFLMGRANG